MVMFRRLGRLLSEREVILFLLIEVLVSIAIVYFTWIGTDDKKEALLWGLSGIGLLWILTGRLQLAFFRSDVEHRFKVLDRGLEAVAGLRTTAFNDPSLAHNLKQIVGGAGKSLDYTEPEFRDYIRRRVDAFAFEMAGVVDGVVRAPASVSSTWAAERLKLSREVFATTFSTAISTFWATPGGSEYLNANIAAHRNHHVKITRAFILRDNVYAPSVVKLVREHVSAGLEVWITRQANVDPGVVEDFIAFDFKYVAFWESAHASDELNFARWSSSPAYIERAQEMRAYLKFRSEKIKTEADLNEWLKAAPAV